MEQEFKFALTEDVYHQVFAHLTERFGPPSLLNQANHFFDTNDGQLQGQGIAVRLRQQNDDWLLTCKWGRKTDGALATVQEFERPVDAQQAADLLAGQSGQGLPLAPEVLAVLDGEVALLQLRAGFTNKRQRWLEDGLEIALDAAVIGGVNEWELEVELQGATLAQAAALADGIRATGVVLPPQPRSKLQRLKQRRPEAF